ncbi:MAG TPA: protein phosphatase 2C domain-containing protein [Caulobacteraceae bacterium]|jgi:serine/threonine protein phosphatase PrpC
MGFLTVARTHVGRRRKINEDAMLARPDLGLWAVADGMGGHHAGDVASAMVVEALEGIAAGGRAPARSLEAQRLLAEANARLVAMAGAGAEPRTIGSTVAVLLADDGGAFHGLWAGDSRIYHARAGALAQLTRDHTLVQLLVEVGEIQSSEAQGHPNANIVTRAVGVEARLELDEVRGEARPGDLFLLASDGVTRLMDEAELLAALQADDLEESADRLVDACLERGGPDNLSFLMVRVEPG